AIDARETGRAREASVARKAERPVAGDRGERPGAVAAQDDGAGGVGDQERAVARDRERGGLETVEARRRGEDAGPRGDAAHAARAQVGDEDIAVAIDREPDGVLERGPRGGPPVAGPPRRPVAGHRRDPSRARIDAAHAMVAALGEEEVAGAIEGDG